LAHLLRLDVANDTLSELSSRGSILKGIRQVSSRDDKSATADTIKKVTVNLGTTSLDVSEGDQLERVAESKSNLRCCQRLEDA
jgi:hypothetical protein